MTEYIDRNKVLNHRETVITDDYSGNETLEVVLAEEILGLTPADVVERQKIDKAIEEMELEYSNLDYHTNKSLGASYGIRKSIEILKRNIGESK